MQKKHLQCLLLILLLLGCKPIPWGTDNIYLVDNKLIRLEYDENTGGAFFFRNLDVRIPDNDSITLRLRIVPYIQELADILLTPDEGGTFFSGHRVCSRSLTAVRIENPATKTIARCIPVAGGNGVALSFQSPAKRRYRFTITAQTTDSIFIKAPVRKSKSSYAFRAGKNALILASTVRLDTVERMTADSGRCSWTFTLAPSKKPRLLLVFDRNEGLAQKAAEKQSRRSPHGLDESAFADFRSNAAFALKTEDDSTNQVFALLSSTLAGAAPRMPSRTYGQIADLASTTVGMFLASRERPGLVFPGSAVPPRTEFTAQEARDFLRWGAPAYRAALNYGMADSDSLHALSLRILTGLSSLQRDYVSGNIEAVADPTNKDEYMRLAESHVRLADLWALGEEISAAHDEPQIQRAFRKESLQARRIAQHFFTKSAQQYRGLPVNKRAKLLNVLDTTEYEDPVISRIAALETFPDTSLFLLAGARYGFNWLDDRPELFWNPRLAVGTFTWQRWTAHRMCEDTRLKQTPDFERLLEYVLNGGIPGVLTARPLVPSEPSLPAMAAALQNLAEVYLGVQPNALRHYVNIEPRLPASWGHTTARIPYGRGYLLVEYDFTQEYALVGMTGIEHQVDMLFGWPLESTGYMRRQFALLPGNHPMRIELEHKAENRLDLKISEVP